MIYIEVNQCKSIYLIGYSRGGGGKPKYAMGIIKGIGEDNYDIRHLCKSDPGSSGSPIINLNNNRVIGIHKGTGKQGQNWNLGTLLKEPIKYFKEININNKYNNSIKEKYNRNGNIDEITILYQITKENEIKNVRTEFIERVKKLWRETVSEKKIFGAYINIVLLCFANIRNISSYILKNRNIIEMHSSKMSITFQFSRILLNLFTLEKNNNNTTYPLKDFHSCIIELNPIFKELTTKKVIDFVVFFIDKLDEENKILVNNNRKININLKEPNIQTFKLY